jgi:hypothetical protein
MCSCALCTLTGVHVRCVFTCVEVCACALCTHTWGCACVHLCEVFVCECKHVCVCIGKLPGETCPQVKFGRTRGNWLICAIENKGTVVLRPSAGSFRKRGSGAHSLCVFQGLSFVLQSTESHRSLVGSEDPEAWEVHRAPALGETLV